MADYGYPTHRRRGTLGESLDFCELCGCAVERSRLILSEVQGLRGHWICDTHAGEAELRMRPSFDDMGGVNNTIGYPGDKPEPAGGSNNIWWEDFEVSKPTVTVEAVIPQASETGQTGLFRFRRQHPTLDTVLAVYYAISGTANAGVDYYALSGVATFIAGADFVDVQVVAINDSDTEGNETVIVTIAANAAYTLGDEIEATVNLVNEENPSSWSFESQPVEGSMVYVELGGPVEWEEVSATRVPANLPIRIETSELQVGPGDLTISLGAGTTAIFETDFDMQIEGEDVPSFPYSIPVGPLTNPVTVELNPINGDGFPYSYRLELVISDGLNTKAIHTTTHRYVFTP